MPYLQVGHLVYTHLMGYSPTTTAVLPSQPGSFIFQIIQEKDRGDWLVPLMNSLSAPVGGIGLSGWKPVQLDQGPWVDVLALGLLGRNFRSSLWQISAPMMAPPAPPGPGRQAFLFSLKSFLLRFFLLFSSSNGYGLFHRPDAEHSAQHVETWRLNWNPWFFLWAGCKDDFLGSCPGGFQG